MKYHILRARYVSGSVSETEFEPISFKSCMYAESSHLVNLYRVNLLASNSACFQKQGDL